MNYGEQKKPYPFHNKVFHDHRGYFIPLSLGVHPFVQDNFSFSRKGTFRGLHYQEGNAAQGKLVMLLSGKIIDYVVNLETKKVESFLLDDTNNSVWVPKGYAHGFFALEDSLITYKVDEPYSPESEKTLFYNDPSLNGQIGLKRRDIQFISTKDSPYYENRHKE